MGKLPKSEALRAVEAFRKKFKRDDFALVMREGGFAKVRDVCPTGIDVLDHHVIGIGGLPVGRLIELKGEESAGKTTLLSKFMGAAQKEDFLVHLQDAENKFVAEWAELHGCNVDDIVQMQAATLEEFHDGAMYAVDRPGKARPMIALDSIASIPTQKELEEGTDIPAEHARLWTKFLRPFAQKVARRQALVVFVNQIRMKVGVMFGNPETTFGGKALKYAYTLRLNVSHGKHIKDAGVTTARYMHVTAEKNQLAPPSRRGSLRMDFSTGFDDDWATVEHAKEVGCLDKAKVFSPAAVREARENLGWPAKAEAKSRAAGRSIT